MNFKTLSISSCIPFHIFVFVLSLISSITHHLFLQINIFNFLSLYIQYHINHKRLAPSHYSRQPAFAYICSNYTIYIYIYIEYHQYKYNGETNIALHLSLSWFFSFGIWTQCSRGFRIRRLYFRRG